MLFVFISELLSSLVLMFLQTADYSLCRQNLVLGNKWEGQCLPGKNLFHSTSNYQWGSKHGSIAKEKRRRRNNSRDINASHLNRAKRKRKTHLQLGLSNQSFPHIKASAISGRTPSWTDAIFITSDDLEMTVDTGIDKKSWAILIILVKANKYFQGRRNFHKHLKI